MIPAILSFLAMAGLDFIWARYTLYIVERRAIAAGLAAGAIAVCNGAVMVVVVQDPWMILPTALGAFAGTILAVKRRANEEP